MQHESNRTTVASGVYEERAEKTHMPMFHWLHTTCGEISQHFQCSKEVSKGLTKGSWATNVLELLDKKILELLAGRIRGLKIY